MVGFNPQPSRSRRWMIAALILLAGGAVAWWASARETQKMRSVEAQVQTICRDLAQNVDLTSRVNAQNPIVAERVLQEMRRVLSGRDDASLVQVNVISGDARADRAGSVATPATHTAILHMGDVELLALRIRCDDPDKPIQVLGYVTPASR